MAGKSDARVRYTQHALKQALLTLLKEKSVNKITVKEVCELAELNRATFYSHYSDCFALLEAIENELLEAFAQSLTLIKSFDVAALIEAIYDMIGKNEEACRVLIFQNPGSTVIHRMIDYARPQSIAYWRQELRASDEELEMLYNAVFRSDDKFVLFTLFRIIHNSGSTAYVICFCGYFRETFRMYKQ